MKHLHVPVRDNDQCMSVQNDKIRFLKIVYWRYMYRRQVKKDVRLVTSFLSLSVSAL